MFEKFANTCCLSQSEFLDLNHTSTTGFASALSSAKFVQRSPQSPTNFALGTLAP